MGTQVKWTGADATELRKALGISQRKFAEVTGIKQPTIKKWVQRGALLTLSEEFAQIMDIVLTRATPQEVARFEVATGRASGPTTAVVAWSADDSADCVDAAAELTRKDLMVDRRQASQALIGVALGAGLLENVERWLFFEDQSSTPGQPAGLGLHDVEQLENVARAFRDWDDRLGGGLRRKAVVGQLAEVNDILRDRQPIRVEQRLWLVMAQLAETAATMSWDSGQQSMAQQYYALSARAASRGEDPAFCAYSIAGMARQLLSLDGSAAAGDALELIRIAHDRGRGALTPTVEAMLYTREAWAYGQLGRPSAFRRACDKARERFSDSDPAADPFWVHYFDAAELAGTIGGRLLEMARHTPMFAAEAAEHISAAIELRRPDRFRSGALDRLGLAEARIIEGEVDEACRVGHDALAMVEQTQSDRVRVKASKVFKRTGRVKDVAAVAELRDRLRPLVST
ncbi:helix-turn-helix domain-containing protein [Nocardia australiensis]|uniref:helix-turn-helix domain-containing protein n=1 Tax=Nocardia australiensis TaxID=2887191 RepID=UPI001D15E415|nr:helix-turn-helix transcriptional regulator [Nocardia australiensis]